MVPERVEKNRRKFLANKRKKKASKNEGTVAGKPKPHQCRPPEQQKDGKRVIYGKPHTWNKSKQGWDKDETPDSRLPQEAAVNTAANTAIDKGEGEHSDDASELTQGTIPSQDLSQIQLELANLAQSLARY